MSFNSTLDKLAQNDEFLKDLEELFSNNGEYLDESLTEASYGGAFDIADDQFFTREELDEFGYEIADKLTARFNKPFEYNGAFIEDGNSLEVDVMNDEFGEFTGKATIDMRKIKKPSDLNKYQIYIMDDITNQVSDVMKDFYGESFTEDVDEDADWDNGLWYDEKEGCLMASKDVFDDWEDSQSLKESSEDDDEAWDYETSEKELKVFTNNWTIDKGSFNVSFEKEKEDMSDILKKHGYQVEVSGDDRGTPIEYHFEFYKVVDESVNFNKPHSHLNEAELDESLKDVIGAIGGVAKSAGKAIYDAANLDVLFKDTKAGLDKLKDTFNKELTKSTKERYKKNAEKFIVVNGIEVIKNNKRTNIEPYTRQEDITKAIKRYDLKKAPEDLNALLTSIFEGKVKKLNLLGTYNKYYVYVENQTKKYWTVDTPISKDYLLKLDAVVNKADEMADGETDSSSTDGDEVLAND